MASWKHVPKIFSQLSSQRHLRYMSSKLAGENLDIFPRLYVRILQQEYDLSKNGILRMLQNNIDEHELKAQRFIPERHDILGPDLATAHFLVCRGGAVKFLDHDKWIRKDKNGNYAIPNRRVDGLVLEAVDASGTNLLYRGLDNFVDLHHLRYLSFSNCPNINDWCLSRLHIYRETLEFLDLSGCSLVTHRGLATLHHLYQLKVLRLANMKSVANIELMTLMLEEAIPGCQVIGIDHDMIAGQVDCKLLPDTPVALASGVDNDSSAWQELTLDVKRSSTLASGHDGDSTAWQEELTLDVKRSSTLASGHDGDCTPRREM